ncbi:MAG TPA: TonB-dependent receptor [Candidatus Acidoferrales bacterium]|nr:TonB-dependent receptor [Candidatus Acidoferrales bacterium]
MRSVFRYLGVLLLSLSAALSGATAFAQVGSSGSISGTVKDATGGVIGSAAVEITNPVSGYKRYASTGSDGSFKFVNVPFNPYHLVVTAKGFASYAEDVDVRSSVPVTLQIGLQVAGTSATVTVEANGSDLIENDSTAHTDIDRQLVDTLPLESQSSSLSSLVTLASPGISADSNGLFHGFGDHASNSFSVDDQPITDQQSKIFSNQVPVDSVQSLEVIQGAPPAEYGDKTSVVIVVTTRSGLGVTQPHGEVTASYGNFGTANAGFNFSYGGKSWGNFISANGLNTGRFLDGPEFVVMHDKGNQANFFDRVDYKPSQADTISLNFGFTRSWFQTPNSFDAENATAWNGLVVDNGGLGPDGLLVGPQDQRSKIRTFNIAPTWTHLINADTVFTLGGFARQDQYNYYGSDNPFADFTPDLQFQTVGQSRRLTNVGAHSALSYVRGIHNIKAGVLYEQTFLTEGDNLGIVDPTFNAVCLNADGSADTNPLLTDQTQCIGTLQPNLGQGSVAPFNPLLACLDLTRTASLPASDGCASGTSAIFKFPGHTDIKELALYVQDSITFKNWTFNVGIRGDLYNGITSASQAEPRVGAAYNIKKTNSVLRLSYARTLETPFNENLVLASNGCNNAVVNALMSVTQGFPCLTAPLSPGTRNEFHAGIQQAFGRYLVVDGEYIWKYTNKAYDFSVLGNTPITFPIEWDHSKIPGYAVRATVPSLHGFTAFVVFSSVAARFFTPQVSGIGAAPSGSSVFRIDHDEKFNMTAHLQYQPWIKGPWFGFNWRYDSGLVAGPVPCFGGNCAGDQSVPNVVDVSGLTPDQQFEAGLFCGSVRATPTTPISPTGSCPASQYGSTLLTIPAPGTEDDDHNPPRVAPRSLFDASVGDDNLFHADRYKWSLRLTAINITNKYALYNFLSTFSGTHYVTPRSYSAELGFHF